MMHFAYLDTLKNCDILMTHVCLFKNAQKHNIEMVHSVYLDTLKNCDILMHSEKEKPTGFVAY